MKYISTKEASVRLKLSKERIREMCRSNEFNHIKKINNQWFISSREIRQYNNSSPSMIKKIWKISWRIFVAIVTILTFYDILTEKIIIKKVQKSFIIPEIKPADDKQVLILVMNFEQIGTKKYDISGRIAETLTKNLTWIPGSNIKVKQLNEHIPRSQIFAPSAVGAKYNATILIWGNYDDAGIKPSFAIPTTLPFNPEYSKKFKGIKANYKLIRIAKELDLLNDYEPSLRLWNQSLATIGTGREFNDFPLENSDTDKYITEILPQSITYLSSLVLGILYHHNKEFEASSRFLDKCLNINKRISIRHKIDEAYYYRGMIYFDLKDYSNALHCFDIAIEENKNCYRAYIYRAHIHKINGNLDLSKNDCEFILRKNFNPGYYITKSDIINLFLYYARTCIELNLNFKAEEYYYKILEFEDQITSENVLLEIYSNLGFLTYYRNEKNTALKWFNKAINKDSTNAYSYYWKGKLYQERNNIDSASYYFKNYHKLESDSARKVEFMKHL